jgi:hypothetical protein
MTCRLPQTPRTPTTAAAHYFDDIFTHTGKPKKPHHLRRSSTTRSIGHRSDWETSTNGEEEGLTPINRSNLIGFLDEDALKKKAKTDQHVASYVRDQLERIRSNESPEVDHGEFETSLDGTVEKKSKTNGHKNGGGGYFDKDPYHGR